MDFFVSIPQEFNRNLIAENGNYIEVHISTPLETCEKRDVKGLYAKARAGMIKGFTGIDDPYESPERPDLILTPESGSPEDCAKRVLELLEI